MFGKSDGKLLYDPPAQTIMFVSFMGAATDIDDDGRITEYIPRGEVVINVAQICAIYEHTVIVMGHKIRVMESVDEIVRMMR